MPVELRSLDERLGAGGVVGPAREVVALAGRVLGEHDRAVVLRGDVKEGCAGAEGAAVGVEQDRDDLCGLCGICGICGICGLRVRLLPRTVCVDRKCSRRHGAGSHKQAQACSDSRSWSCIFHKHSSFGAHERGRFSLRYQPYAAGGSGRFTQYIR